MEEDEFWIYTESLKYGKPRGIYYLTLQPKCKIKPLILWFAKIPGQKWIGGGFCNTGYAADYSLENFMLVHLLATDAIDFLKQQGVVTYVEDTSQYFNHRNIYGLAERGAKISKEVPALFNALRTLSISKESNVFNQAEQIFEAVMNNNALNNMISNTEDFIKKLEQYRLSKMNNDLEL